MLWIPWFHAQRNVPNVSWLFFLSVCAYLFLKVLIFIENSSMLCMKRGLFLTSVRERRPLCLILLMSFISLCMNLALMIWELTPYCCYLTVIRCPLPDTAAKTHVDKQRRGRRAPFSMLGLRTSFYFSMHTYVLPLVGQTSCQRSRANALISSWRQSGSKLDASATDLFVPYCLEVI